jgi:hypothetical protein
MSPRIRDRIRSEIGSGIESGMKVSGLPFDRMGILAGLQAGSGLALTATDQLHEFLRRRYIAAKFAALLRHRATRAWGMRGGLSLVLCLQGRIDPQFGLAGFAGRGVIANIDVATAHDGYPFLRRGHNAQARAKLQGVRLSRPEQGFGSSNQPVNEPSSSMGEVPKCPQRAAFSVQPDHLEWRRLGWIHWIFPANVSSDKADETFLLRNETIFRFWRRGPETAYGYQVTNETAGAAGHATGDSQMRTISFILAFAFILAGPSMAGSSDQHLPGVGTFAYNGSPVATPASQPMVVAAN